MPGVELKLFLADGSPSGVIIAELRGGTCKVLAAPRSGSKELFTWLQGRESGVYLLTGPEPGRSRRLSVYVGESEDVKQRIEHHLRNETGKFCDRICVVVSQDDDLTKAHGRYLEGRLFKLIEKAGRANLRYGQKPTTGKLRPSGVFDMKKFLGEIEVILPIVGFDLLRVRTGPRPKPPPPPGVPTFEFTLRGVTARAREVSGKFVVLAGSHARKDERPSCRPSIKKVRKELVQDNVLVLSRNGKCYRFARDYPFGSTSGAAAVVAGGQERGPKAWRVVGSGETYDEWSKRQP